MSSARARLPVRYTRKPSKGEAGSATRRSNWSSPTSRKNLRAPMGNRVCRSYKASMKHSSDRQLPDDLDDVARRLRDNRYEPSALDLDRIKTRAMAGARSSGQKGFALRSKGVAAVLAAALM